MTQPHERPFLDSDALDAIKQLRAEGQLDAVQNTLLKAEPTPAVADELRKTLSAKARLAKGRGDWQAVIHHLEFYLHYADKWRQHCVDLVNQEPPPLTNRDRNLLESARQRDHVRLTNKTPSDTIQASAPTEARTQPEEPMESNGTLDSAKPSHKTPFRYFALLVVSVTIGFFGGLISIAEGDPVGMFFAIGIGSVLGFLAVSGMRRRRYDADIDQIKHRLDEQRQELESWKSMRVQEVETAWFDEQIQSLSTTPIRDNAPEVEVEAKFIYPLLSYLGYDPGEMSLRVPVPMQEGSEHTVRQADVVVHTHPEGDPLIVIEAKAPRHWLDDAVAKQARSYAFRLEAPVYATTNGKELHIYHRGVLKDQRVLSCEAADLRQNWDAIEGALAENSVQALKELLS